jgi:cytidylate kinase
MILAIDGPAGAGKSTVAKLVAEKLGVRFLDSGAMYRAVTLEVLRRGLDPGDEAACGRIAASLRLEFDPRGRIVIDGRPAEPDVRGREVTAHVSTVSAHAAVRERVVAAQRALAARWGGLVAEGRDMASVVFPHADHKLFLIASPLERARRRAREIGTPEAVDEVRADIDRRDRVDSTREHSPLRIAPGAVEIDTDGLSVEQVVERILALVRGSADVTETPRQGPARLEDEPVRPVLVRKTLGYRFAWTVTRLFCEPWFRPRFEGVGNVPREGGVVVLSNHQSFLDIPLITHALPRHVCFVARDTLRESRIVAWLLSTTGAVLIKRGSPDRAALREMVAHLERGDLLAIFAEGTRTRDGTVGEFRAGALLAARLAKVPIVPCGIRGAFEALPRDARLPRPRRIGLRFAPPIDSGRPDALEAARAAVVAMVGDGRFASVPPAGRT